MLRVLWFFVYLCFIPISASKMVPGPPLTHFYGRIEIPAGPFGAFLSSGWTDFEGESTDLANIYIPSNDYDTWRQSAAQETKGWFSYQIQNSTISCLTIMVSWSFGGGPQGSSFKCNAAQIASNWDCHLNWALTSNCQFDSSLHQVNATYALKNLGSSGKERKK